MQTQVQDVLEYHGGEVPEKQEKDLDGLRPQKHSIPGPGLAAAVCFPPQGCSYHPTFRVGQAGAVGSSMCSGLLFLSGVLHYLLFVSHMRLCQQAIASYHGSLKPGVKQNLCCKPGMVF